MPRDASATRERILEAAFREFATHGLAGARVDRIAENARANKRAIYEYFGDKQRLFDATLARDLARSTETIARSWDNLPDMAGDVYDYWVSDPDRMRLLMWRQLERPQPVEAEVEAYRTSLDQLRASLPAGCRFDPVELYALIWALHFTWRLAPPALVQIQGEELGAGAVKAARRNAIVEAVRRLVAG